MAFYSGSRRRSIHTHQLEAGVSGESRLPFVFSFRTSPLSLPQIRINGFPDILGCKIRSPFSIPVDNPLEVAAEIMNQDEAAISEDSDTALAFICKRLRLNYTKLTDEEKKWLTRIANKSDLLKLPVQRRGKKK